MIILGLRGQELTSSLPTTVFFLLRTWVLLFDAIVKLELQTQHHTLKSAHPLVKVYIHYMCAYVSLLSSFPHEPRQVSRPKSCWIHQPDLDISLLVNCFQWDTLNIYSCYNHLNGYHYYSYRSSVWGKFIRVLLLVLVAFITHLWTTVRLVGYQQ